VAGIRRTSVSAGGRPGLHDSDVSAGARPGIHNRDGRQRFQRKRRKDILDGNIETLISAVESRCIRAIERALGGAGWFGFQQALHGILGTVFWRKTLRAVFFPWNLGYCLLAENFACGEKTAVDFLEQNFHRLSMESWALSSSGKLCVRRKSRS